MATPAMTPLSVDTRCLGPVSASCAQANRRWHCRRQAAMASLLSMESHNSGASMQGGSEGVGADAVRVMADAFRMKKTRVAYFVRDSSRLKNYLHKYRKR